MVLFAVCLFLMRARRPAIAGQAASGDQDPKSDDEDTMVNHWESRGLLEDGEGNEAAVVAVETKESDDDDDDTVSKG